MTRRSVANLISRLWEWRHDLTPYDATYVALAASLETQLVTRDRRLEGAPITACEIVLV